MFCLHLQSAVLDNAAVLPPHGPGERIMAVAERTMSDGMCGSCNESLGCPLVDVAAHHRFHARCVAGFSGGDGDIDHVECFGKSAKTVREYGEKIQTTLKSPTNERESQAQHVPRPQEQTQLWPPNLMLRLGIHIAAAQPADVVPHVVES
jgi:hypothetical protein